MAKCRYAKMGTQRFSFSAADLTRLGKIAFHVHVSAEEFIVKSKAFA